MSDRPKLRDVEVITAPSMQPVSLRKLLADLGITAPEEVVRLLQQNEARSEALADQVRAQVDRLEALVAQLKAAVRVK